MPIVLGLAQMLQFIADQIDQLDLALDQLAMQDRNFDRFALMLIDNVVELTLHEHARSSDFHNRLRKNADEPLYNPKLVAAALGSNFDRKVRLAQATKMVSDAEANSLLALHSFRNVVYHQGIRHESILHSLGIFYLECACVVMSNFTPQFWCSTSKDQISHRAIKYLGSANNSLLQKERLKTACSRLQEVCTSLGDTLITDLHADMQKTIEQTDEALNFLSQNSPTSMTRTQAIIEAQVWPFALTDDAKDWAKANGWTHQHDAKYVDWLSTHYHWPISRDPIASWKQRLANLHYEGNRHAALKKYADFMKQTERVRQQIDELAIDLDGYIQQQIDEARGK